jgi:hypothetical protein
MLAIFILAGDLHWCTPNVIASGKELSLKVKPIKKKRDYSEAL